MTGQKYYMWNVAFCSHIYILFLNYTVIIFVSNMFISCTLILGNILQVIYYNTTMLLFFLVLSLERIRMIPEKIDFITHCRWVIIFFILVLFAC